MGGRRAIGTGSVEKVRRREVREFVKRTPGLCRASSWSPGPRQELVSSRHDKQVRAAGAERGTALLKRTGVGAGTAGF